MRVYLLLVGILIVVNAAVATVAWMLLSRKATRPPFARAGGALLGAAAGAWLAVPELNVVYEQVCVVLPRDLFCNLEFAVPVLFVYPFALPVTTGLSTWLLAEIVGGRGAKPLFALGWTVLGAGVGAALVFVPLFFIPGAEHVLPRPLVEPVTLVVPAVGALLGLALGLRG
jgi:hypothetical protein